MRGAHKKIEALSKQGLQKKPLSVNITATASANELPVAVISALPFVPELAFIAYFTEKGRSAAEYSADGGRFSR